MMVNVKLGDKTYDGVEKVKLNTTDGGEVIFAPDDGSDAGYSEGFNAGKAEAANDMGAILNAKF